MGRAEEGEHREVRLTVAAVRGGVPRAHVLDGRVAHSLLLELFTDEGVGTMVVPDAVVPDAVVPS